MGDSAGQSPNAPTDPPVSKGVTRCDPRVSAGTAMPAARAASTPGRESSTTRQRAGSAPIAWAAWRKRSGAGLPRSTSEAVNTRRLKRSSPVTASERAARGGEEDVAMQAGTASAARKASAPAVGRSSRSKRPSSRRRYSASKPSGSWTPKASRMLRATVGKERPRKWRATWAASKTTPASPASSTSTAAEMTSLSTRTPSQSRIRRSGLAGTGPGAERASPAIPPARAARHPR